MVKGHSERLDKYNAKIDADAVRIRIANYKEKMGQHFDTNAETVAQKQLAIRTKLNGLTGVDVISPAFTAPYMACGMEILGLQNKGYSGATLDNEVELVFSKWESRGASTPALSAVAEAMGVEYTPS